MKKIAVGINTGSREKGQPWVGAMYVETGYSMCSENKLRFQQKMFRKINKKKLNKNVSEMIQSPITHIGSCFSFHLDTVRVGLLSCQV